MAETIRRVFMREEGHQAGNGAANKSRVEASSVVVALQKMCLKKTNRMVCLK